MALTTTCAALSVCLHIALGPGLVAGLKPPCSRCTLRKEGCNDPFHCWAHAYCCVPVLSFPSRGLSPLPWICAALAAPLTNRKEGPVWLLSLSPKRPCSLLSPLLRTQSCHVGKPRLAPLRVNDHVQREALPSASSWTCECSRLGPFSPRWAPGEPQDACGYGVTPGKTKGRTTPVYPAQDAYLWYCEQMKWLLL